VPNDRDRTPVRHRPDRLLPGRGRTADGSPQRLKTLQCTRRDNKRQLALGQAAALVHVAENPSIMPLVNSKAAPSLISIKIQ
jgi:hypothetical protein